MALPRPHPALALSRAAGLSLLQHACLVPRRTRQMAHGLCVHVLPFDALLRFVEAFLEEACLLSSPSPSSALSSRSSSLKPTDVNRLLGCSGSTCASTQTIPRRRLYKAAADAKAVELERTGRVCVRYAEEVT